MDEKNLRVPKTILVNTREQHKVEKTIDDFIEETTNLILEGLGIDRSSFEAKNYIEIKNGFISYRMSEGVISDDQVNCLYFMQIPIASVLETRDEQNWVRYSFFRNLENLEIASEKYRRITESVGNF